jgi:hypothetical protein
MIAAAVAAAGAAAAIAAARLFDQGCIELE